MGRLSLWLARARVANTTDASQGGPLPLALAEVSMRRLSLLPLLTLVMSCAPSEDVSGSRGYLGSPVLLRSLELAYRTTAVGGASGPATPSGIERIRVRVGTNGYATSISASNLDGVLSRRPATTTAACEQWLDDWGLLLGVEDVRLELVSRRRILDRGGAERIRFSQVHPAALKWHVTAL